MDIKPGSKAKKITLFEQYLPLWVALCMGVGIVLGKALPGAVNTIRWLEFGEGSQINIPIAVLIWLMIYPMMLKVDFGSIAHVKGNSASAASR
jgi:arsenite transporter